MPHPTWPHILAGHPIQIAERINDEKRLAPFRGDIIGDRDETSIKVKLGMGIKREFFSRIFWDTKHNRILFKRLNDNIRERADILNRLKHYNRAKDYDWHDTLLSRPDRGERSDG